MSEVFKTPMPFRTPKCDYTPMSQYFTPKQRHSDDSDESAGTAANSDKESTESASSTQYSNGDISMVAKYDDIVRMNKRFRKAGILTNNHYLGFVEQVQTAFKEYCQMVDECKRLQTVVDAKSYEVSDLEYKLSKARKMVDVERAVARNIRRERDDLAKQIGLVQNLLFNDRTSEQFPEDVRHKLSFLHQHNQNGSEWGTAEPSRKDNNNQLKTIREINSTGSMLSEFSYSRSEDDLDVSVTGGNTEWKKHRPSSEAELPEPANKKRRSSANKAVEINATDTVRATTTLTVTRDGPIKATSIIESIPQGTKQQVETQVPDQTNLGPPPNLVFESWSKQQTPRKTNGPASRGHTFQQKILVIPDTCSSCEQRLRFGKTAFKCKECKSMCHPECKDTLPLPCVPQTNTPNHAKNFSGAIRDYTPATSPMVPALLMHCVNEIELRGFSEVGLYRISGSEREVRTLKERLLKCKTMPALDQIDVHVLCGVVKEFLRGLREPLVTFELWQHFVNAAQAQNPEDAQAALYQVIAELPKPNRDTLAYMMVHLQKVAEAKECKMNTHNLARVFGPTIVGYSSDDIRTDNLMQEVIQNNNVMEHLINLPALYWSRFIDGASVASTTPSRLQQTPSTDSLLRSGNRGFFAQNRTLSSMKRPQRYFPSPKR